MCKNNHDRSHAIIALSNLVCGEFMMNICSRICSKLQTLVFPIPRIYLATLAVELVVAVPLRYLLCLFLEYASASMLGVLSYVISSNMYAFWVIFRVVSLLFLWWPLVWSLATFLGFTRDDRWSATWRAARPEAAYSTEYATISDTLSRIARTSHHRIATPSHWRVLDGAASTVFCVGTTLYMSQATLSHPDRDRSLAHVLDHYTQGDGLVLLAVQRLVLPPFQGRWLDWDAQRGGRTPKPTSVADDPRTTGRVLLAGITGGVGIRILRVQWQSFWQAREQAADELVGLCGEPDARDSPGAPDTRMGCGMPYGCRPAPQDAPHLAQTDAGWASVNPSRSLNAYRWIATQHLFARGLWILTIFYAIGAANIFPIAVERSHFLLQYGQDTLVPLDHSERIAFEWQPNGLSNELYITRDAILEADNAVVLKVVYFYRGSHSIVIRPVSGTLYLPIQDISGAYDAQPTRTGFILRGRYTFVLSTEPPPQVPHHLNPSPATE
jgi:hypothetical protein